MNNGERQTLTDCFTPPDGLYGVQALLCGYTADSDVMDMICQQFSGRNARSRRAEGRVWMTLLCDGRQPQISSVAGLYHAGKAPKTPWHRMHAKVALCAYGPAVMGQPTTFKVIVSTGNWTHLTISGSVDLLWTCEIGEKNKDKLSRRDVFRAASFLRKLCTFYRFPEKFHEPLMRMLDAAQNLGSDQKSRFVENLCGKKGRRDKTFTAYSLGSQVLDRFAKLGKLRNLLVCGSGFFEIQEGNEEPSVLAGIRTRLQLHKAIRTRSLEKWLLSNPSTAGAVAQWVEKRNADELDWFLATPWHPDHKSRPVVHAKFIFLGDRHEKKGIRKGQLYLGSGNLTRRGFALAPGGGGNVEAGVVVPVVSTTEEELSQWLGIHPEDRLSIEELQDRLEGEGEDDSDPDQYVFPPILSLSVTAEGRCEIEWSGQKPGKPTIVRVGSAMYTIPYGEKWLEVEEHGQWPSHISVFIGEREWQIPVFAPDGRLARAPRLPMSVDEICATLVDFQNLEENVDDDDDEDDDEGSRDDAPDRRSGRGSDLPARESFPLQQAMKLVESIAARNQLMPKGALPDWIDFLRDRLVNGLSEGTRMSLAALGVNFLEPLKTELGFSPPMQVHSSNHIEQWQVFIDQWIEEWGWEGFQGFSEMM